MKLGEGEASVGAPFFIIESPSSLLPAFTKLCVGESEDVVAESFVALAGPPKVSYLKRFEVVVVSAVPGGGKGFVIDRMMCCEEGCVPKSLRSSFWWRLEFSVNGTFPILPKGV
jgi:hypothetical protein